MDTHSCDFLPPRNLAPCTIIIFGGSGDLTRRKLIPALYSLYREGKLPETFAIVGSSRTVIDDVQYRESLRTRYEQDRKDLSRWHDFAAHLHYFPIRYDQDSFSKLKAYLHRLDLKNNTEGNRLYDLAVPPHLYPVITRLLGKSGLTKEKTADNGWSRIVVEKPFGNDLDSALELDRILHLFFKEQQIFRIDHYLAKETVQNMLTFRFANAIFEPIWNRSYIDHIGIIAAEELGVGSRAGYYEQSGVVRDMFQNHLMQLLVLTAMEPPCRLEADAVHDEKSKVIRSLRKFNPNDGSRIWLGQYTGSTLDGEAVCGYRQEQGVESNSTTPTFALLETFIDNWRWQGVPFYLMSGKRLARKQTQIIIQFREVPHKLFQNTFGDQRSTNRLTIETFPEEAIRLRFQTKSPGPQLCLRSMEMDFTYQDHYASKPLDAYARVLLDCIIGDHMLFWRQDGIEASWSFLTPVLEACEECEPKQQLSFYPVGTWGPSEVKDIVQLFL